MGLQRVRHDKNFQWLVVVPIETGLLILLVAALPPCVKSALSTYACVSFHYDFGATNFMRVATLSTALLLMELEAITTYLIQGQHKLPFNYN